MKGLMCFLLKVKSCLLPLNFFVILSLAVFLIHHQFYNTIDMIDVFLKTITFIFVNELVTLPASTWSLK